ncbi:MAG: hypothetical protein IJZ46_04215 [Bacilli bacterium]|nr:hypothetical protein [Bacilli bacterium]
MKEATSEVSGTVITIVIIALVAAVAGALFYDSDGKEGPNKSIVQGWIEKVFNDNIINPSEE